MNTIMIDSCFIFSILSNSFLSQITGVYHNFIKRLLAKHAKLTQTCLPAGRDRKALNNRHMIFTNFIFSLRFLREKIVVTQPHRNITENTEN
jgi:hypothetical protein